MIWISPLWEHPLAPLHWAVVLGAALAAAVWDVRTGRVPNVLTFPVWIAGLAAAGAFGGWAALGDAFAGSVLAMLPFVILFALAGGGAGDAKMMGALGAWLGVTGGIAVCAAVALVGGLLGVILAVMRRRSGAILGNMFRTVFGVLWAVRGRVRWGDVPLPAALGNGEPMRYGVAIFIGTCITGGAVLLWGA